MPMEQDRATPEQGLLRIYLHADDRVPGGQSGWRRIARTQTCRQLVRWAHDAGMASASVYRSGMGFIGRGPIVDDGMSEAVHPRLIVCVEVAGSRDALRAFVDRHAAALARAIVEYHATERWDALHVARPPQRAVSPARAHHHHAAPAPRHDAPDGGSR